MKFLIFGAGAIGSAFGGFLAKAGHRVTLIGRQNHIQAIQNKGLHITGIWGDHQVNNLEAHVHVDAVSSSDFKVIFISTKSQGTDNAIEQIKSIVGENTLVVSLQNGLGNLEKIEQAFGKERSVGGRVIFGSRIESPGSIRITVIAEPTMLGTTLTELDHPVNQKVKELVELLDKAGLPTRYSDKITSYLWAKILYNCPLNPLGAILGVNYGKLTQSQGTIDIMNEVIREIFAIAHKKKVVLFWKTPEEYIEHFYNKLLPPTQEHKPSMLMDLLAGKPTEIEAINGIICHYAAELGIPVPYNQMLTNLIRFKEKVNRE